MPEPGAAPLTLEDLLARDEIGDVIKRLARGQTGTLLPIAFSPSPRSR
jgi:hypothetical protein